MMSNSQLSLQIPPLMWQQIRQAMLDARRHHEETIGFLFCSRDRLVADRVRYLPKDWVVPAPDCYELQSASGLILKQDFHKNRRDAGNSVALALRGKRRERATFWGEASPQKLA